MSVYDNMKFPPHEHREYPKMMYHPKGETTVIETGIQVQVPTMQSVMGADGAIIMIPGATVPKVVGEKTALVSMDVNSPGEEQALLQQGWHTHPGAAVAAREGRDWVPPITPTTAVQEMAKKNASLEEQIKQLQEELATERLVREAAKADTKAPPPQALKPSKGVSAHS